MPNSVERPSLDKTLEERYAEQTAGGAYNAKDITTDADTLRSRDWMGTFEQLWTRKGFRVKPAPQLSDFKDVPDRQNGSSAQLSMFIQGLSTRKYKP